MKLLTGGDHQSHPFLSKRFSTLSKGCAMSIFSTILEKLGLHKEKPATTTTSPSATTAAPKPTAAPAPAASPPKPVAAPPKPAAPAPTAAKPADDMVIKKEPVAEPAAPKPISDVDVVKQLELKAKGTGLNWKQ